MLLAGDPVGEFPDLLWNVGDAAGVGDVGEGAADPGEHVRAMTSLFETLAQRMKV